MGFSVLAAATGDHVDIHVPAWHWVLFLLFAVTVITIDLTVIHRKDRDVTIGQAAVQTLCWITLGIAFGVFVLLEYGGAAGAAWFGGYSIEQAMSMDNVFVWSIILTYFAIPDKYQYRVLLWGIIGAMVMRLTFVMVGAEALSRWEWLLIPLACFLIYAGIKTFRGGEDDQFDPESSRIVQTIQKVQPLAQEDHGHKFWGRENGHLVFTMLFVALLAIEFVDVLFAVDSVPASLALVRDPFLVFTSNVMAIMGLRALYFVFDALKDKFGYMSYGLGIILAGVGVKMLIGLDEALGVQLIGFHINIWLTLGAILVVLASSIIISILKGEVHDELEPDEPSVPVGHPAVDRLASERVA